MELLDLCPQFCEIDGWLKPDEGEALFQAAKKCTTGVIVEVGSAFGKSTVALALGAQAGQKVPVFAIDPHEDFEGLFGGQFGAKNRKGFYENMLAFGGWRNVRLINLSSEVITPAWTQEVMLLWIDGDHRYDAVWRDILCWQPHLGKNAKVIFDDVGNPKNDPDKVFRELIETGLYELEQYVGKVGILRYVSITD